MNRFADLYFKLLEGVLVLCLGAMVLMVLGNVILRYGFNSGITVSEELSRFAFIWLTFLGAIVGLRENAHLGIDTLVRRLPRMGRQACFAVSHVLMLLCCALFFIGTWRQRQINLDNVSPVTGLQMEWVFGVAYVSAGSMAAIILARLWQLASGQLSDEELIAVVESEENEVIEAAIHSTHEPASPGQASAAQGGRA